MCFWPWRALIRVRSQDPPPSAQQPVDQYFAGVVTALTDDSITLTRTVLGKATVRTFAITTETKYSPESGKPKLKQKVTVKWVSDENGDSRVEGHSAGVCAAAQEAVMLVAGARVT